MIVSVGNSVAGRLRPVGSLELEVVRRSVVTVILSVGNSVAGRLLPVGSLELEVA